MDRLLSFAATFLYSQEQKVDRGLKRSSNNCRMGEFPQRVIQGGVASPVWRMGEGRRGSVFNNRWWIAIDVLFAC